ncbi:unnamed protein product [Cuscuta epithymum]|uniref:Omega-hydroxypalmitate O-feruloyl transferase n=1 Tax=Cuscuta epithymum TaxID=186058 RepID=A0AAV0CAS8_9ASTE|nr:unnamed protein product [Cuscuta epithymum]
MGSLKLKPDSLPPRHEDLKVTVLDSGLIFPPEETEKRSMFLSNIDIVLNFDVQTVHFFSANPGFAPEMAAELIKNALRRLLLPYDFLAGRLKKNPESSGRLEIDCNGAGAGFVRASSQFALQDVGDLVYPNPAFRQLVTSTFDFLGKHDQPLCIVQVTSFTCGGFVMGVSTNHAAFDGSGFHTFLQNLASQARNNSLAVVPCNDRSLLAARSPPRVTFPHPELLKLNLPDGLEMAPQVFNCLNDQLSFHIFHLTSANIHNLKAKANATPSLDVLKTKVTSFNVITAHIWRCKALSCDVENNIERLSTVLFAVDIRSRLNPPLPPSYAGNAVLTAFATAKCGELEEGPFWKTVQMVYEGAARVTDEYARSAIDWGEMYKGFPNGEFLVSSWWKLGFEGVEYPWGKPKYSCPVVYHRKDIILLFPDIEDQSKGMSVVNVLVALPPKEMETFHSLFHKFLA